MPVVKELMLPRVRARNGSEIDRSIVCVSLIIRFIIVETSIDRLLLFYVVGEGCDHAAQLSEVLSEPRDERIHFLLVAFIIVFQGW